ncbi:MAG: hydroxymethylglutaryl-CoA lyase [Phycisphaerales bacterium]
MTERVRISDVSPRDGLQNEPGVVPTADKIRLVEAMLRTNVDEIEVSSFVSPKWVPQLGDAAEVFDAVGAIWPGTPTLSALVPNERGFDAACAVNERSGKPLIGKVSVFTAASETFSKKNTNASIDETIERFAAFVPRAFERGFQIRMYVSCAVACPFEGPIAPDAVRAVVGKLRAIVPSGRDAEIDLGDTIGVATTDDIRALLGEFDASERAAMTLHLHDTFGRAGACVREAIGLGVRSFDGSVAGLGGCPYAGTPEKPAPGNISTETLVRAARDAGLECAVDDDALAAAAGVAREIVAEARARQGSTR